ncbi:MAG: DUF11 domain-containing protein [Alcaligenaceae bacterium]|nr:MAG: DUF11 domain-containing protein [Alcaligenaceae bacterium]
MASTTSLSLSRVTASQGATERSPTWPSANIRCDFTNTRQSVLRLQKTLPNGRAAAADQFTLTINGAGEPISTTTTGATNAPTQAAVLSNGVAGTTYTLFEVGSGGANLGSYTSTYLCTNALAGGQTISGSGTSFDVTLAAADDLTCTFSNARSADLSIVKTALPTSVPTGGLVNFTLAVLNAGPSAANGAVLRDAPDASLDCTQAGLAAPTCTAIGGASCPAALTNSALTGTAGVVVPTLPAGGRVIVTMQCRATATGKP